MNRGFHEVDRYAMHCHACRARWTRSPAEPLPSTCPFCAKPFAEPPDAARSGGPRAEGNQGDLARQHADAMRASMQAREQEALSREQYRLAVHSRLIAAGEIRPATAVVVLPAVDRPLAPLAESRKQKFLAYIAEVAERAAAQRHSAASAAQPAAQPAPGTAAAEVRQAACGQCRGACCVNGGEHGYLLPASLLRAMAGVEQWTAADVVELYRGFLPEASHADSCVFHTDRGCTIPVNYRSDTCNAFICQGLAEFETQASGREQEVLLTANRDGEIVRRKLIQLKGEFVR